MVSAVPALVIVLNLFGINIADLSSDLVSGIIAFGGLCGTILAIYGRITATKEIGSGAPLASGPKLFLIPFLIATVLFGGLTSCGTPPTQTQVGGSAAVTVGLDAANAAAQATQAYIDVKAGNVDYAWAVAQGLQAYQLFVQTKADVANVVHMMGGDTTLAQKLAAIFGSASGTPAQKAAVLVKAVQVKAAANS
jgi:hypothetical protein